MFSQVKPIDLNSPPQTQLEVGQSSQQPFFGSTLKKGHIASNGQFICGTPTIMTSSPLTREEKAC